MRQDTFTWGDATVTVREPLGLDAILESVIHFELGARLWEGGIQSIPTSLFITIQFAQRVFCQSTVQGDIGFVIPAPTASSDELFAGYQALMTAPRDLVKLWKAKIDTVSKDPVETEINAPTAPESHAVEATLEAELKHDSGGVQRKAS